MRKAEVITIALIIMGVLTLGALVVVEQKIQHSIVDGSCTIQPVYTLVPLDKSCTPAIELRDCNNTNKGVDVKLVRCLHWIGLNEGDE